MIRGEPTWEPISILPMNRRSGPTPLIWRSSCGGGGRSWLRAGRESRLARIHHITVRGSEWYDHIARRGGHAVSFVQHFYGTSYQEAMELLLGKELGEAYPAAQPKTGGAAQALRPADTPHRYAPSVCLSDEAAAHQSGGDQPLRSGWLAVRGREVPQLRLCGYGRAGVPRHAHKRSTNSRASPLR